MFNKESEVINPKTRGWDTEMLSNMITEEKLNEVTKISINSNLHEDKVISNYDKKGVYTIKSGYYLEIKEDINNEEKQGNTQGINEGVTTAIIIVINITL